MLKYAIIAAVGAASITGVYLYAFSAGKQSGRIEQLENSIKAEKDRKGINKSTSGLSDHDLCIRAGGLPEDCRELLGVDSPAEDKQPGKPDPN